MSVEPEIIFDLRDGIAEVTLNRPQALNALTLNMVRILDSQLAAWETDDAVCVVVVRGAGDKAFGSGGDISIVTCRYLGNYCVRLMLGGVEVILAPGK